MTKHKINVGQIQFTKINQVDYETIPTAFQVGPDDILIQTTYSLVSAGTELAKLTGKQKVEYPFIPGNRAVGEVVAVGEAVKRFQPGDHVFSHTPHVSHTLSKRLCVPVPADVEASHSPLVGLAMVAMTALRIGEVELGDRAVVIGLGIVGNLAAQLLSAAGAEVIALDMTPGRLAKAEACGLQHVINVQETDAVAAVMDLTSGQGADVVVEASGNPQAAELAVSLTGKAGDGKVVLLGSPRKVHQTDLTPFLNSIHLWRGGSVTIRGAHEWRYPLEQTPHQKHSMERNAEIIFRLMAKGKLKTDPLITHHVQPAGAAEAFAGLAQNPDEYVGVVFDWTGESGV